MSYCEVTGVTCESWIWESSVSILIRNQFEWFTAQRNQSMDGVPWLNFWRTWSLNPVERLSWRLTLSENFRIFKPTFISRSLKLPTTGVPCLESVCPWYMLEYHCYVTKDVLILGPCMWEVDVMEYCDDWTHFHFCLALTATTTTTAAAPVTTTTTTTAAPETTTTTTAAPETTTTTTAAPETTTTTTAAPETTTTTTAAPETTTTKASATQPPSSGTYDCDENNPCNAENAAAGKFYFPNSDPTKFVQCSEWGQCYVMPCGPGTVWDQSALTCNYPPKNKIRRSSKSRRTAKV